MTKDAFIERISFPAERGHHGAALGNGCLGLLLWGSGRTLRVSIGCCALWDHEGGIEEYPAEFRMENVKQALAQGNEAFLRQCAGEGQSHPPSMIPAGRLEIQLPEGAQLEECLLPLDSGKAIVRYRRNNASSGELEFLLGRGQEMQALFAVKNPEHFSCRLISSQELNSDGFFSKNHYPPISRLCARPRAVHSRRNSADGFVQNLPEGGGYALRQSLT